MDEQQKHLLEELLFSGPQKKSIAKSFFFGRDGGNLQLPGELTTQENEFIRRVEEFAEREIDGAAIDRNQAIPERLIQGLGKLGVLGMTIAPDNGGLGYSQRAYCRAVETVARRCGSTALFINAHQSIGLKALLLYGTEQQRARWLAPLARGEQLAAFALTEANAGSDAAGIETTATFDAEKNVYLIQGRKQWITNGAIAQILTVMARTEDGKITAFLVTPDMPGFQVVAPSLEKVGMRGTKTAILAFKDVAVPAANILGPKGGGLKVCLTVLDYGRTTFGAACIGAAKYAFERAVNHAHHRYQFKRPLSSFGLVKEKLARMAALAYAMEATTYATADLVDQGIEDVMLEAAILKVFSSDALWEILFETMQIFGGRSFFTDEPLERMMRDARLNTIGEGSNEVLRAFIGVVGMRDVGMQLKGVADAFKQPLRERKTLWNFMRSRLREWRGPKIAVSAKDLQEEAAELGRAIRAFGWSVTRLLATYKEEIVEEQLQLNRIATAAIALYTARCVLKKLDQEDPSKREAGRLYLHLAFDTLKNELKGISNNRDSEILHLADQL